MDWKICSLLNSPEYVLPNIDQVSQDAKRSLMVENAGGNSHLSEMYSIDWFCKYMGARDVILEKEVQYWVDWKMVDFICTLGKNRVGISVTRAMGFPLPSNFTQEDADKLLYKKIHGLILARNTVIKSQRFFVSILHIWCQSQIIASMVEDAYTRFQDDVGNSFSILITICTDETIYSKDKWKFNPNFPNHKVKS